MHIEKYPITDLKRGLALYTCLFNPGFKLTLPKTDFVARAKFKLEA